MQIGAFVIDRGVGTTVERRDKTGMKLGMKESYRKGDSDSILTASFARVVVRRHAKHKQRHRWAGY